MKHSVRPTRSRIAKILKKHGITLQRVTQNGQRTWLLSNGVYYPTLRAIAAMYPEKKANEK